MYLNSINLKYVSLTFILCFIVACSNLNQEQNSNVINGKVMSVVAKSISEVDSFEVKSSAGTIYRFETNGFIGFTPSHIKEHQITGEPVTVTFIREGSLLVATEITD
ncbi:MAG: hypothetical protein ACJ0KI_06315 [Dehalococcoidia bacterium]